MQTLKQTLEQDHSSKTKKQLVELLKGIKEILGGDYDKITGLQVSELSKTRNEDLLAIINDFREKYDEKWESDWAKASVEVMEMIFSQMKKDETFSASNVSDGGFAAELGGLDFANLIGGPLNACVEAQTNASLATVSFINEVGFTGEDEDKELVMTSFSHKKETSNPNFEKVIGTGPGQVPVGTDVTSETFEENIFIELPLITMFSIPSFRIETCEIDFNVKLNSVYTKKIDTSFGVDASLSVDYKAVKFDVSVSYKRSSSTGIKVEKEYSLGVKVKATNDEMPAGLEKILGILAG